MVSNHKVKATMPTNSALPITAKQASNGVIARKAKRIIKITPSRENRPKLLISDCACKLAAAECKIMPVINTSLALLFSVAA